MQRDAPFFCLFLIQKARKTRPCLNKKKVCTAKAKEDNGSFFFKDMQRIMIPQDNNNGYFSASCRPLFFQVAAFSFFCFFLMCMYARAMRYRGFDVPQKPCHRILLWRLCRPEKKERATVSGHLEKKIQKKGIAGKEKDQHSPPFFLCDNCHCCCAFFHRKIVNDPKKEGAQQREGGVGWRGLSDPDATRNAPTVGPFPFFPLRHVKVQPNLNQDIRSSAHTKPARAFVAAESKARKKKDK